MEYCVHFFLAGGIVCFTGISRVGELAERGVGGVMKMPWKSISGAGLSIVFATIQCQGASTICMLLGYIDYSKQRGMRLLRTGPIDSLFTVRIYRPLKPKVLVSIYGTGHVANSSGWGRVAALSKPRCVPVFGVFFAILYIRE